MMKEYNLAAIGTGAAGLTVAYECNSAGWKVAIADYRPFGGTCALRGCDPKKVLVGAAEVVDRSQAASGRGISREIRVSWPELMEFKRTFTDPVPQSMAEGFSKAGIGAFHGRASFIGKNTIRVGEQTLECEHIVIATGAQPRKLGLPGEEYLITSEQFLELNSLPESVTFIGGGYISFEFAHVAARAGAKVRILEVDSAVLRQFDPDLVKMLTKASEEAGIEIRVNVPIHSIVKRGEKFVVRTGEEGEQELESDIVVHGAGRVPELAGLDLEKGEIEVDKRGIVVNEYLQSVSNASVYVVGDANRGGVPLTPVASRDGTIVAKNLLEGNKVKPDYTAIPGVVFTLPPLASVGIQEEDAIKRSLNYEKHYQDTASWHTSRRINLRHSGFKLLIERDSKRILGAHLLGHNAEEVINIFALAMKANLSTDDLRQVVWAYPTTASDITYML